MGFKAWKVVSLHQSLAQIGSATEPSPGSHCVSVGHRGSSLAQREALPSSSQERTGDQPGAKEGNITKGASLLSLGVSHF